MSVCVRGQLWGVLALAVALSGAFAVPAVAQDAALPSPVSVRAELLHPDGRAVSDEAPLKLGGLATFRLVVEAPPEARIYVPTNPAIAPLRLKGTPGPPQRKIAGKKVVEVHDLPVTALRVGVKVVKPVEVPYRLTDGTDGSVMTQRLKVRVLGHLTDVQDPTLAKPPLPVPVIGTNWVLVWSLTVLGAAVLTALLTLLVLFFLRAYLETLVPPPPPRPANEVALEALLGLSVAEIPAVTRYAGVIDVLRAYLGGRFGFDGLECTTRELMASLGGVDLKDVTDTEIQLVLEDADLVKFAGIEPSDDEARRLVPIVRRVVEVTWEEPEEEVAEVGHRRMEPATAASRLRAGLVDVLLAGALGALTTGGVWVAVSPAWAWLGVLVAGAYLWLRDLGGPGSPGKVLYGLRLVRTDELQSAPGYGARLLRNLLLLIAPAGLPLEALVLVHHPLRRRIGDVWAQTEVVDDPLAGMRASARRSEVTVEGGTA
ncbi:MAG: RDD family protein [Myxococcota bacterium]